MLICQKTPICFCLIVWGKFDDFQHITILSNKELWWNILVFKWKNLLIHYELIFSICHRRGPDVTFWLWDQMNRNRHHTEIQRCGGWYKLFAWPRYLLKFSGLVGNCKPWDFKCTQTFRRGSCPSQSCPRTVTLCNQCVNYDVPGNIHYGWLGHAATIRCWLLLYAADRVQKGGIDDPKDQNAIKIGMNMWDDPRKRSRYQMCKEVAQKINSLNRQGTSGCRSCSTRY